MKIHYVFLPIVALLLCLTACSDSTCPSAPALSLDEAEGYYAVMATNHHRHPRLSILHLKKNELEWFDMADTKTVAASHSAGLKPSGDHGFTTQETGAVIEICMTKSAEDELRLEVQNHPEAKGTRIYYELLKLVGEPPEVRRFRGKE